MNRAVEHQLQMSQASMSPQPVASPVSLPEPRDQTTPPRNKAAARFKKWSIATLATFGVSNILGLIGLIPVAAIGILVSFFMTLAVMVFGVQALAQKKRKK